MTENTPDRYAIIILRKPEAAIVRSITLRSEGPDNVAVQWAVEQAISIARDIHPDHPDHDLASLADITLSTILCEALNVWNDENVHLYAQALCQTMSTKYLVVERECVDHPTATSDITTSIKAEESVEATLKRMVEFTCYRLEQLYNSQIADEVEATFTGLGAAGMRDATIILLNERCKQHFLIGANGC